MIDAHIREHTITVPWDRTDPALGDLEVYARELYRDANLPALLYLQGGPGCPSPRPTEISGWLERALKDYRVILLDQRGTGRSTRIDRHCDPALITARHLALLRAEHIVADCEDLREHLGLKQWDLLGQSFGGFCITTYLSTYPDSVRYAYLTGGLPATEHSADEVYRATYAQMAARNEEFYSAYPWAREKVREVCDHLDNSDERLSTGERLTSRRLRTVGIGLGRTPGLEDMAYLFEAPFHSVRGEKRLRTDFLNEVQQRVSFEATPLYAVIHETIYGGVVPGATNFSAHRMREEIDGFQEETSDLLYLTGEHVYPWQFEEDPALRPFAGVARELAVHKDWSQPYNLEALAESGATCAAAVYRDDCFVPREFSLETGSRYRDLRPWLIDDLHHDGIRHRGADILDRLMQMVRS